MADSKKKIKTTEASRDRHIYMCAISREENLDRLDPPATEEEKAEYIELCKRMRAEEEKAKREGKALVWEIPFDLDDWPDGN